jgi:uncharacterized membrane protein YfcA
MCAALSDGRASPHAANIAAMEVLQTAAVGAVFVLAGLTKGVTGMGLPTVAMSLLGLGMDTAQAAALLVAPSLATNLAQCRGAHLRRLAARLWPAWLALAATTLLAPGMGSGAAVDGRWWLGWVLIAYGAWGLWRPALPAWSPRSAWAGAAMGLATGGVTSLTGVFVMPLVPYLQMLKLEKDEMVQALGLSFTVATLALAARLQAVGQPVFWSLPVLLALGAAFVGLRVGGAIRSRLDARAFQRTLFALFIALGLANLLRIG